MSADTRSVACVSAITLACQPNCDGRSVARLRELLEPVVVAADKSELLRAWPTLDLEFAADGFGQFEGSFHIYELHSDVIVGEFRTLTGLMKADPLAHVLGITHVKGTTWTGEDVHEYAS